MSDKEEVIVIEKESVKECKRLRCQVDELKARLNLVDERVNGTDYKLKFHIAWTWSALLTFTIFVWALAHTIFGLLFFFMMNPIGGNLQPTVIFSHAVTFDWLSLYVVTLYFLAGYGFMILMWMVGMAKIDETKRS